jgi:hypothetical protein
MPIGQPNPRNFGYSEFGQGTPKTVSVLPGSSTQLLSANPDRVYAELNNNGAAPIWVQKGIDAEVGEGTRVFPGGQLTFQGDGLYLGEINAISATEVVNTDVIEGV